MITQKELLRWVQTLDPGGYVAIDDGGLILIEIDKDLAAARGYLEVGGLPDDESDHG